MDFLKELNIQIGQWVKLKDGTVAQIIMPLEGQNFAFDRDVTVDLNPNIIMILGAEKALLEALKDNIIKVANSKEELGVE